MQLYRALYTWCRNGRNFQDIPSSQNGQKLFSTSGHMGLSKEVIATIETAIKRDIYKAGMRPYKGEAYHFFACGEGKYALIHYRWLNKEDTGGSEFGITKALIGDFEHHPIEYVDSGFFNGEGFYFGFPDKNFYKENPNFNNQPIISHSQLLTFDGSIIPPLFKPISAKSSDTLFGFNSKTASKRKMSFDISRRFVLQPDAKDTAKQVRAMVCHLIEQYSLPEEQRKGIIIKGTTEQIKYLFAAIGYAFSARTSKNISFSIGLPPVGFAYSFATTQLIGWDTSDPDISKVGVATLNNYVFWKKLKFDSKENYYRCITLYDDNHRCLIENYAPSLSIGYDAVDNYLDIYREFVADKQRSVRSVVETSQFDTTPVTVTTLKKSQSVNSTDKSEKMKLTSGEITDSPCAPKTAYFDEFESICDKIEKTQFSGEYKTLIQQLYKLKNQADQILKSKIQEKIVFCMRQLDFVLEKENEQITFCDEIDKCVSRAEIYKTKVCVLKEIENLIDKYKSIISADPKINERVSCGLKKCASIKEFCNKQNKSNTDSFTASQISEKMVTKLEYDGGYFWGRMVNEKPDGWGLKVCYTKTTFHTGQQEDDVINFSIGEWNEGEFTMGFESGTDVNAPPKKRGDMYNFFYNKRTSKAEWSFREYIGEQEKLVIGRFGEGELKDRCNSATMYFRVENSFQTGFCDKDGKFHGLSVKLDRKNNFKISFLNS